MDKIKDLLVVLIFAAPFWGIGFWVQRLANEDRSPGYSVEAKGWWTWLMGIRPGRGERVYLGGALLQVWALLYVVVSLWPAWTGDFKTVGTINAVFLFVVFPLMVLAAYLIIRLRNRQR